ncbi:MAG: peptide-methionine (S)-S-oxide reductase MsrA [Erysipelothrix sp.]|nr:peptide-methionine (S)-S-oxide reductase MsrA [Erysipelothrix sp.]
MKSLVLAGGCFWGVEAYFRQFDGILHTEVGYANGKTIEPTYEEVCNASGHAEAVMLHYNSEIITTSQLIKLYLDIVDPVAVNKQGNDVGVQYRTGVYYENLTQFNTVEKVLEAYAQEIGQDLAIELLPLDNFYRAEEEHQLYLDKNPNGYCHIPKEKLNLK